MIVKDNLAFAAALDIGTVKLGKDIYEGNSTQSGIYISYDKFKADTKYFVKLKIEYLEGELLSFGGHSLAYNVEDFTINGIVPSRPYNSAVWLNSQFGKINMDLDVSLKVTKNTVETSNTRFYIQVNRGNSAYKYVKYRIKDLYISEIEGDRDVNIPTDNLLEEESRRFYKVGEFKEIKSI